MLTRREKLLIRPWQLRRYNNHRKKVLSALPVIDFGPPPQRGHVTLKLKKLQKEGERRTKIEEDNFRLLQRMGTIMKKNRLDNFWVEKPPNFLGRVGIYHRTRTPSPCDETTPVTSPRLTNTRKSRCPACSPQPQKPKNVPEGRIPWEEPKKSISNRGNTTTTLVIKARDRFSPDLKNFSSATVDIPRVRPSGKTQKSKKQPSYLPFIDGKSFRKAMGDKPEKRIILEQGPLHLAVNFPIYVDVKVKSVYGEKYIRESPCSCQATEKNDHRKFV